MVLVLSRTRGQSFVFPEIREYFTLVDFDRKGATLRLVSHYSEEEKIIEYERNITLYPSITINAYPAEGTSTLVRMSFVELPSDLGVVRGELLHPDFGPDTSRFDDDGILVVSGERYDIRKKYDTQRKRDIYVAERID